jgi:hypothetical protein
MHMLCLYEEAPATALPFLKLLSTLLKREDLPVVANDALLVETDPDSVSLKSIV